MTNRMTSFPFQKQQSAELLHVAIIMDGNDRWASRRGLPRGAGHRAGTEAIRRIVGVAPDLGISYLTLFGQPPGNRHHPILGEPDLTELLGLYLHDERDALPRSGVRLRVIDSRERLSSVTAALIDQAERQTTENAALNLTFALDDGGRREIVTAVRRLVAEVVAGDIAADAIGEPSLAARLYAPDLPDPDLVIRTGGKLRIDNVLLWQMAYAEFVFSDTLWPDFSEADLAEALADYQGRERRYGRV